jgi:hypothetical protein
MTRQATAPGPREYPVGGDDLLRNTTEEFERPRAVGDDLVGRRIGHSGATH